MTIFLWFYNKYSKLYESSQLFELWIHAFDSNTLYDKLYIVQHMSLHFNDKQLSNANILIDDTQPLLLNKQNINYKLMNKHHIHSTQCIKYQYDYFILSLKDKKRYLGQLSYSSILIRIGRYSTLNKIAFNILFGVYLTIRIYIYFMYPYIWYFHIYLGQYNAKSFCSTLNIDCIKSIWITLMLFILILCTYAFLKQGIMIFKYEYWFGYLVNVGIGNTFDLKEFMRRMKNNEAILTSMQLDIGLIVCEYVGANHLKIQ
eukprot:8730_1